MFRVRTYALQLILKLLSQVVTITTLPVPYSDNKREISDNNKLNAYAQKVCMRICDQLIHISQTKYI